VEGIVAKRRERRDARLGDLNRKRQRTGNDFTLSPKTNRIFTLEYETVQDVA
jgi:hypothetical protein